MAGNIGRNTVSRGPTYAAADLLDRGHERIDEEKCPSNGEAELGGCLRVCGDAARIVVGGPGDKAGTQDYQPQPTRPTRDVYSAWRSPGPKAEPVYVPLDQAIQRLYGRPEMQDSIRKLSHLFDKPLMYKIQLPVEEAPFLLRLLRWPG